MKKKIEKSQDKKTSDKNTMSLEDITKVLGHNESKSTIAERYRKKSSFNILFSRLETT